MYESKIEGVTGASAIPDPKGYKILVAIPKIEEKTKGGIIRPDQLRNDEGIASIFGYVVSMGADCYADKNKFPNGAWCAVGDFVMFRSYSGTRFKVQTENGDQEFRLMNDDMVEAVVADPSKIARA